METAPAWAQSAYLAACAAEQIDPDAGQFLRVGTYATWLLPEYELGARIASTDDAALVDREYRAAKAIHDAEVPVAMPARPVFEHTTGTVGWWQLGEPTEASYLKLGSIARTLHDRSGQWLALGGRCEVNCDLPRQADTRFQRAYALLPDMHAELDQARKLLHDRASGLALDGKITRVIAHGDLSPHNVLSDGRVIDLETAGIGESAIDLARIAGAGAVPRHCRQTPARAGTVYRAAQARDA